MLLIGQPKSASTSLMRTIAEIGKLHYKNGQNKRFNDVKCEGFMETQKYHGTTIKRSENYINNWINNRKAIYKEHILPTKEHLEYLKNAKNKFVVLIRDPKGVINAYKRVFKVLPEMKNIDYDKLYEEAKLFHDIYLTENIENMIVVTYKELVLSFKRSIKKILDQYEIKIPENIEKYKLLKYNYTGQGEKEL